MTAINCFKDVGVTATFGKFGSGFKKWSSYDILFFIYVVLFWWIIVEDYKSFL